MPRRSFVAVALTASLALTSIASASTDQAASKRVYVPRGLHLVYKPRTLGLGSHSLLEGLRWRRWGSSSASARGVLDYADATTSFRAPIHVRLSRIGACGAKRTYMRQTVTFDRASDRRRWGALDGPTELFCPTS